MDPTLEMDIHTDKPWALSPLIATMPHFKHTKLSEPHVTPPFPPPKLISDDVSELPYVQKVVPDEKKKRFGRKAHFQDPARRRQVILGPDVRPSHYMLCF